MNLAAKKYLIFDFDQTIDTLLIDWTDWKSGVFEVIKRYDSQTKVELKQIHFPVMNALIEQFGPKINQDFINYQEKFERSHYSGHRSYPEVVDFLLADKEHVLLLWSNNHGKTVQPVLDELGLATKFVRQVTRDKVDFAKPHHSGFLKLYEPGTSLATYLMIGDADADERAAAEAGIDYIHVDDFVRLIKS